MKLSVRSIELAGPSRLGCAEQGPRDGVPVLFLHGVAADLEALVAALREPA
jgi:hypothetical protein